MPEDPTLIGKTLVVNGEVTASENITIAGRVKGSVQMPEHRLTVASSAKIDAELLAKEVLVYGQVSGEVRAGERLEVSAEASVEGKLKAPRVKIVEGASLNASIDTKNTEAAVAVARYRLDRQAAPTG